MRRLLLAASTVALAGCQTVTFARAGSTPAAPEGGWHHNALFSLVEVSDPVDLQSRCAGGWSRVTTQESFLTGLVPAALGFLFSQVTPDTTSTGQDRGSLPVIPASQAVSVLWDPEYVEVSCDLGGRE